MYMNIVMIKNNNILIVDDEKDIIELLDYNLSKEGYKITTASNGLDAIDKLDSHINLILLDVMMPRMDGLEFCKYLKSQEKFSHIPIIFLTAKDNEIDEIIGLELGADDYIYKPISIHKLKSRIKVILKRYQQPSLISSSLNINKLFINYDSRRVSINQKMVPLTSNEMKILFLLSKLPNKFFSREEILNSIWKDTIVADRTIDTHIVNLRNKLQEYSVLIETKVGVGYSFNPNLINDKE